MSHGLILQQRLMTETSLTCFNLPCGGQRRTFGSIADTASISHYR
jgi:hypothetical protein